MQLPIYLKNRIINRTWSCAALQRCFQMANVKISELKPPDKAKSLGITGKASDAKAFLRFLNALLLPVTTNYNQLREHSREHSYVPRYMSCRRLTSAALSMVVLFFTQHSQRTGLFSLYSPSISPAARTALRTHCAQGQRTLPVSTPFKSLQIVAPLFS